MYQKTEALRRGSWTAGLERRLPEIRGELDHQRRFRIDQLKELTADGAEAATAADEPRLQVTHLLAIAAESALDEIDAALQRLEEGSYGICERCIEPIPWERLETLPMSRLCMTCQYVAESGRSNSLRRGQIRSSGRIRSQGA
jgi:DnaK suppressor protein